MATLVKPLLLSSSTRLPEPTSPSFRPTTCTPSRKKTTHRIRCILKRDLLNIDLPWHEASDKSHYDVIIIGAGLAGLCLAESVSSYGIQVCCIDPSPLSLFPNNSGVWVDEFERMGLENCLEKTWPTSVIHLDDNRTKYLNHAYGRVNNKRLKTRLMEGCAMNGVKFHQAKAWEIVERELESMVVCDDASEMTGSLVVDASSYASTFLKYDQPRNHVYQLAYGILAEVEEHPFDLDKMVLMDWRDSHLANETSLRDSNNKLPTFLYAMPLEKNLIFLEETLVSKRMLSYTEVRNKMEVRLKHLGIKVKRVIEDTKSLIPMGGPLPRIPRSVMGIGGAATLVQPSSGYMVVHVMDLAQVLANVIADCLGSTRTIRGNQLHDRVWNGLWTPERRFSREFNTLGIETMLNLDLMETRDFLDAFYDMDPCHWQGFLSSNLSLKDLPSLCFSLFGRFSNSCRFGIIRKCPLPFATMILNLI